MMRSWRMQIKNKKKQRWYEAAGKAKTLIFLHCADLLPKKGKIQKDETIKMQKYENQKYKY